MNLSWTPKAWNEYQKLIIENKLYAKKLNKILKQLLRDPYTDLYKRETLKYDLNDCFSIRVNKKDRLVYLIDENCIQIFQCVGYYTDK